MRYSYDLHLHSCLSPCGDDDMTPGNIAQMAAVNGLAIAALTDHNSTRNCPAFFALAKRCGVVPVAGMELTTAEDVHLVCLFPTLDSAMAFGATVEERRVRVKNKPAIFGRQVIRDENDEECGEEEFLLLNATTIDIPAAVSLAYAHGGVCFPAHIDRPSNGIVAVLGTFPSDVPFTAFELHADDALADCCMRFPHIRALPHVTNSDAHYLWDMHEGDHTIELPVDDTNYSAQNVRDALIRVLRQEV
ncbi:MAG: PHP domain-containing protein [Clostridiales bacterium]|nr:PHP domain-containing protein [Clostridiales bacterium]